MTHIISKVYRLYTLLYLFIAITWLVVGFLALNGNRQWDLTQHRTQSLSAYSREVINKLDQPTTIHAFVKQSPELRQAISRALAPYLRVSDKLTLRFEHPDKALGLVKKFGVAREGTLILAQRGRFSTVNGLTESAITKGLEAVQRIQPLTIGFAYGHGERYPEHQANFHYAKFAKALEDSGLSVISVDLSANLQVPDNIDVLVLADPRLPYSVRAKQAIDNFVAKGKNVLVLAERESVANLVNVFDALKLPLFDGVISNNSGQAFGVRDNSISVIKPSVKSMAYPPLANLPAVLLFPETTVLDTKNVTTTQDWTWYSVLHHAPKTLVMQAGKAIQRDDADMIAEASRLLSDNQRRTRQRIVVIADADFLSNRYIGNGANRDFGVRLLIFLARPAYDLTLEKIATDRYISISDAQQNQLARTLVVFIPLSLLIIGLIMGHIFKVRYQDES